jgi:hypothetical protein
LYGKGCNLNSNAKEKVSRLLRAVTPDGEELTVYVAVGEPYQREDGAWAVPVTVDPLEDSIPDMVGGDSWQATKIAMNHSTIYLKRFIEKGGKLFFSDSEETEEPFTLEDIDEFF